MNAAVMKNQLIKSDRISVGLLALIFRVSPKSLHANTGIILEIGHGHLIPNNYLLIIRGHRHMLYDDT